MRFCCCNLKRRLSLFTLFSIILAVFIFWFQFHFYLICLSVSNLRLYLAPKPKNTVPSSHGFKAFSSVIPSNIKIIFKKMLEKKSKPLRFTKNVPVTVYLNSILHEWAPVVFNRCCTTNFSIHNRTSIQYFNIWVTHFPKYL